MTIEEKIKHCETIPELQALRHEIICTTFNGTICTDAPRAIALQKQFIMKMNKLKRIPLRDRNW